MSQPKRQYAEEFSLPFTDLPPVKPKTIIAFPSGKPASPKPAPKPNPRTTAIHPAASTIYDAYPVKVARPVALKAISKALATYPWEQVLERTQRFAALRPPSTAGDCPSIPHPSTWFNQERFNDDESTWLTYEQVEARKRKADAAAPIERTDSPAGWEDFLAEYNDGEFAGYKGEYRHAKPFMQNDFAKWMRGAK